MILYQLATPIYGETHIQIYEVLETPGQSIRLTGDLGSVDAEGNFVANPDFDGGFIQRTISGSEFGRFIAFVNQQRAEASDNYRHEDLTDWMDQTQPRGRDIREEPPA